MRKLYPIIYLMLLLFVFSGCSPKENAYIHREDALKRGYILLDGTNSLNHERFEMFLQNVDAEREDDITIIIYDLTNSQYVLTVHYDGSLFHATKYFITEQGEKSQELTDLLYTHMSRTSAKNYFLMDEASIHMDLWIYQGQ